MIKEVEFDGEECHIKLTGNLTQIANESYQVARVCYEGANFRWRLEALEYKAPKAGQLADMGLFTVVYNRVNT